MSIIFPSIRSGGLPDYLVTDWLLRPIGLTKWSNSGFGRYVTDWLLTSVVRPWSVVRGPSSVVVRPCACAWRPSVRSVPFRAFLVRVRPCPSVSVGRRRSGPCLSSSVRGPSVPFKAFYRPFPSPCWHSLTFTDVDFVGIFSISIS